MNPTWQTDDGRVKLWLGDCLDVLPTLAAGSVDAVVTDPPYGMGKADWDREICVDWMRAAPKVPTATFCGVIGMRDYPTPDWVGAWVRQGSTQRNGRLRGFNNWEPILFYGIESLANDVIAVPNFHDDYGHPSVKPDRLMLRLVEMMPAGTVLDPFMGSGTTGVAAVRLGRQFLGCETDPTHYETAKRRIIAELERMPLFEDKPRYTQAELVG